MGRIFRKLFFIIALAILAFVVASVGGVLIYKWAPVEVTPLMYIRAHETGDRHWQHRWVPLSEISPSMPLAVISSEDNTFVEHNGFDFKQIEEARKEAEAGGRVRGASTITQQTAKNVFLWPGRSWVRKGLEAWFTVLIETFWSKERIMEVYLNSIEMGPGIYGVDACARNSFGVAPSQLTRQQCALIAATLPNPLKYSSKHPGSYMLKRQKKILRLMSQLPSRYHLPKSPAASI